MSQVQMTPNCSKYSAGDVLFIYILGCTVILKNLNITILHCYYYAYFIFYSSVTLTYRPLSAIMAATEVFVKNYFKLK